MGASRERKKRQEYYASGGVDKKAVRAAEERASQRRFNIGLGVGAGVFVLLAAFLLIYNSGILQRGRTAVTVGDKVFTAADYSYYYHTIYSNYYQQYGDMAAYFASGIPDAAVSRMQFVTAALDAAEAEGFTYTEEIEADIQEVIDATKEAAGNNAMSYRSYVSQAYGHLVTVECFERNLRETLLANAYSEAYQDTLTYTDAQIDEAYEAAPQNYDYVNGILVSVSGTPETKTDEEGNTIAATDEEKEAAMEAAAQTAEEILAAYEDGGDLEELAEEHGATYTDLDQASYSAAVDYSEWLFDDARKSGDCATVEGASGWYVVVFHDRGRDETQSVNVRHILINGETVSTSGMSEEESDEILEQTAELLLNTWDHTEEGFASLAMTNSRDAGSAADGGLIENVLPGQMVEEFEDWCFDPDREPGDTGIIHTDYGCHIMYFVGQGDQIAWKEDVRSDLFNEDYTAWETDLTEDYEVSRDATGMGYVA